MGNIRNLDLKELINKYKPQVYLDLGAGYGTSIYWSLQFPFNNILSVEINKEQTDLLNRFFRFDTRVKVYNCLTVDFLRQVLPQIPIEIPLFILLDAHFENADLGEAEFDFQKNEDIKLPLIKELEIIKELRADKGGRDLLLADDISLYDDSDFRYEDDHKKRNIAAKILPKKDKGKLPFVANFLNETHTSQILPNEQGYVLYLPK